MNDSINKESSVIKTQDVTKESIYLFDMYDVVTLFTMYNWNEWYLYSSIKKVALLKTQDVTKE